MAEKSKRDKGIETASSLGLGTKAQLGDKESKDSFVRIRDDGAICFGDECVVINPTETGRLGLTIQPDKCGEQIGAILVDYLVRTAGKGVVIEIPSEFKEGKAEE
ncbi:hypothetical protein ES705_48631 [subsurface metagenome]